MASLFDILNDLYYDKANLLQKGVIKESDINLYSIMNGLIQHPDLLPFAHFINHNHKLKPAIVYQYLFDNIPKKKRFGKWGKAGEVKGVEEVKWYYKCNELRAMEIISLLDKPDLDNIIKSYESIKPKRL